MLKRDNVCHQVGFSLEASRCDFHSARLEKSFSRRVERVCVSSVCRFTCWSVRDSMCLIVGAFSRIGVFVANVSRQSAYMLEVKRPTQSFARKFQRRSATMCITKLAWRGRDVVATIFGV